MYGMGAYFYGVSVCSHAFKEVKNEKISIDFTFIFGYKFGFSI